LLFVFSLIFSFFIVCNSRDTLKVETAVTSGQHQQQQTPKTKKSKSLESNVKLKINGLPVITAIYSRANWNITKGEILHRCVYRLLSSKNCLIHYFVDKSLEKSHKKEYPHPSILHCVSRLLYIRSRLPQELDQSIHDFDDLLYDTLIDEWMEEDEGNDEKTKTKVKAKADEGGGGGGRQYNNVDDYYDERRNSEGSYSSGGSTTATGTPFLSPADSHYHFPSSPLIPGDGMSNAMEADDDRSFHHLNNHHHLHPHHSSYYTQLNSPHGQQQQQQLMTSHG
jgi:hypothetical protein